MASCSHSAVALTARARLSHLVEIHSGAEHGAAGAEHQDPRRRIAGDAGNGRRQLGDQFARKRVALSGPIEGDRGHSVGDFDFDE